MTDSDDKASVDQPKPLYQFILDGEVADPGRIGIHTTQVFWHNAESKPAAGPDGWLAVSRNQTSFYRTEDWHPNDPDFTPRFYVDQYRPIKFLDRGDI